MSGKTKAEGSRTKDEEGEGSVPPSSLGLQPSKKARLRLAFLALLLGGWLLYLGYLAFTVPRPVVLSRPQLLVSTLDVLATLSQQTDGQPNTSVTVEKIHWPNQGREDLVDRTITVANLSALGREDGWNGPGTYILPLVPDPRRADGKHFLIAPIPRSPGYEPGPIRRGRIYPLTPQTLRQLETIPKPE